MSNPWLKKNPFMSMWLSGANSVANAARGKIAAEAKRQSTTAMSKATNDMFNLWTGATPRRHQSARGSGEPSSTSQAYLFNDWESSLMAAWLIPALKAIIPHVGTIVAAAAPVFTKKTADKEVDPLALIGKQIAELQSAAARNSDDTKELAGQLQGVVTKLEKAASQTESRLRRAVVLSSAAIVLSVCAVGVAIAALVR